MNDFMGKVVTVGAVLKKRRLPTLAGQGYSVLTYERETVPRRAGWIVGKRTLVAGTVEFEYEAGNCYTADGRHGKRNKWR